MRVPDDLPRLDRQKQLSLPAFLIVVNQVLVNGEK